MNHHSLYRAFGVTCLAFVLMGCAGHPPAGRAVLLSHTDLLSGSVFNLGPGDYISPADTLAVNDDMRAFVKEHVPPGASPQQKINLILTAMLGDDLQLSYNNFKTYTAQEAFYEREANCLSFTHLFVALARESGVRVSFQEVEVPANWTMRGNTYRYNRHLNALVNLPGNEQIVDFNLESYKKEYHRRLISDDAALAQYHNNLGVHWLSEGDMEAAFLNLRVALELRPHTAYFWTNLGTLYRHAGHMEAAEAAFLTAIDINHEPTATSNLARLYAQLGQSAQATYYREKVQIFRAKNPYYLFHQAENAYGNGEYTMAETLLRKAIRYRKDEHEFYRLLGLSHLQQGNKAAAERRFRQAANLVDNPVDRERYNHKLDLLAGN